jgi:uncharacterized repeat protein (TIGR01451 family)
VLQPDGKLVAAGGAGTADDSHFALARYHPDGTLDSTFGLGGLVTTDFDFNGVDGARAVAIQSGFTARVSVDDTGAQGNSFSFEAAVSGNGDFVAFVAAASNLVAGDTNGLADIFVRDLRNGRTERVNVANDGTQADDGNFSPDISSDGRFVVFNSFDELVQGDTNNSGDVYVRDRLLDTTERVSVDAAGNQANGTSFSAAISADGRHVAFTSFAPNLVSGDTNRLNDVFVKDRQTGAVSRASLSSTGEQANNQSDRVAISADGRVVAFRSFATNLVPGDTNSTTDIFVHELDSGLTERMSINSDELQANLASENAALSSDGTLVAFDSAATNLVDGDTNGVGDIFVRDRSAGTTVRVSVTSSGAQTTGGGNIVPEITADGTSVAFASGATNLVANDTNNRFDIFVKEIDTGTVDRVSVASDGAQADGSSAGADIDSTGRIVGFDSAATNLVSGDTNGQRDVFVHDRGEADVAVDKTDDPDPARVGRQLTYTLDVDNLGPSIAWDATLTDVLPEGARLVSATSTSGACLADGGQVTCRLGDLSAGGAATVTIVVRPIGAGTLVNVAEIASALPDPDASNNQDVETTIVTRGPQYIETHEE